MLKKTRYCLSFSLIFFVLYPLYGQNEETATPNFFETGKKQELKNAYRASHFEKHQLNDFAKTNNPDSSAIQNSKQSKQTLRFTKNIGQTDKRVKYQVNDAQAGHYLLRNEIRTVISKPKERKTRQQPEKGRKKTTKEERQKQREERERAEEEEVPDTTYSYGLQFLGTQGPRRIKELKPEIVKNIGKKNIFRKGGQFTDIPQFGQLRYEQLWKGIDADFYASEGHLKYDFIVAPGADPRKIKFQMDGVEDLSVDAKTGELLFRTPLGELRKGIPYTYQLIDSQRVEVKAKYVVKGKVVSFEIGTYDPAYPLTIDPIALKFATFLGGDQDDWISDIYVHPVSKKIYMAGTTSSRAFPGLSGSKQLGYDGFVTCMSKDGSTVLWTTLLGGSYREYFHQIYVSDDEQDVFVSGESASTDYPTDGQLFPYAAIKAGTSSWIYNPVFSRLSGDGSVLKYSTYFPTSTNNDAVKFTVMDDVVYSSVEYGSYSAFNYPINLPEGGFMTTPPSSNDHGGQLLFGINTAKEGQESFQYGSYFYDDTPGIDQYIMFSDAGHDAAGNIYFGGLTQMEGVLNTADNLWTDDAIQSISDIQNVITDNALGGTIGWIAQLDSTLSEVIYATPLAPIMMHSSNYFELGYWEESLFNLDISDAGDIYMTSTLGIWAGVSLEVDSIDYGPTAKVNHLQPVEPHEDGDMIFFNFAAKISAADRSQYDYVVTAPGEWWFWDPAGGVVDGQGRLHWAYNREYDIAPFKPLATSGALQSEAPDRRAGYNYTQYVVLDEAGDLEYATVISPTIDFGSSYDHSSSMAIFVEEDGSTCYIGGWVENRAQRTFPVTPSYYDPETGMQVFVYDAIPTQSTSDEEGWLAVFHNPVTSANVIQDFAPGNDTFCVDGLIYQDPNYGPILGDPLGFISGDGSDVSHSLPDIRPAPFTEAHPDPTGGDGIHWEISRDGGSTWSTLPGSSYEVYLPEPEISAGTVQYRRAYDNGDGTFSYSNIATAVITGTSSLDLQSPTDVVYFCPGTVEDFSFPILGASDTISWQWYNGFAPISNSQISPASGYDLASNFIATVPVSATNGGYYRLVVEEKDGCVTEAFVRILPLSDNAGTGSTYAICPGDVSNSVTLGPSVPNPDFEYSWTGPGGFTSNNPNPVVTLDGMYYLQVREIGDPSFCAGGQDSILIMPLVAHDSVLQDTSINLAFCQSDAAVQIGLAGPAPAGYTFQWSPNVALDDVTAFNPTFYPGTLPFGPPVSEINYTFSALRQSDGCIFEDTISVAITAFAEPDAGDDTPIQCAGSYIAGNQSSGYYFEWRAVNTTYPGGLAALTSTPEFSIDGVATNLGTNETASLTFPMADTIIGDYSIEYELRSSYIPFPNTCYGVDNVTLFVRGCAASDNTICPDISTANVRGNNGVCDLAGNILTASGFDGGAYEWTTYRVDGVLQPAGTAPRGLFTVNGGLKGTALAASGPHPTEVITDLEDATWGWPGASSVEYRVTVSTVINDSLYVCSENILVFSGVIGNPVVDVKALEVCYAPSPGLLTVDNGVSLPYTLSGTDYNVAPNSALVWSWDGEGITANGNSPYPTLNPTVNTSYIVMAMDSLTGCFTQDNFDVTLRRVVANAGDNITAACEGAVVQLGTSPRSHHTYQWGPSSGLNYPIGTPNDSVAQPYLTVPAIATEYGLTVIDTITGCEAVDTVLITPRTSAPGAPSARSYTSCPGQSFTIGRAYNPTGITFGWTAGAGADMSWLSSTTINLPTVTLPSSFSGTATFRLTVTNGSCGSAFRDYTITNEPADVALGADVTAVCSSPLIQIGSAIKTANFVYLWSPSQGLYTDAAGTIPYTGEDVNTVYAKPTTTTTYRLIANNYSTGCLMADEIVVSAPPGIDVDAGPDQVLCPDEASVSIGQSGSGTISWTAIGYTSNPSGAIATPTTADSTTMMGYLSATNTPVVTFSQSTRAAGIYEYQVTSDYGGGCIATDNVRVTVSTVSNGIAGNNHTICSGNTTTIGVTAIGGVNYSWSILNPTTQSGTISNTTLANPTVDPLETTSYQLNYTDNSTGCTGTEVVTITVVPGPLLNDASIGPVCAPATAQDLTALIAGYGSLASAMWYRDYIGGSVVTTPTAVVPTRSTNYYLVGNNTNGCSDTAVVSLSMEAPETPALPASVSINCLNDSLDLADYQNSPSDPSFTLEWHSDNTTNPATLLTSTVVDTGTYYLFERSTAGCYSGSDFINVVKGNCPDCDDDGVYDFEDYCLCDSLLLTSLNSYGCGFSDSCSYFVGDTISIDTAGVNNSAGYITIYAMADSLGVIVDTTSTPAFTNLTYGKFMALVFNFKDDGTIANLAIGNNLSDVDANCIARSGALTFRVCSDEICNDGIDNDGDGLVDIFDSDCCRAKAPVLSKK